MPALIKFRPRGPVVITGDSVRVQCADGRRSEHQDVALCLCAHSCTPPYCDKSHQSRPTAPIQLQALQQLCAPIDRESLTPPSPVEIQIDHCGRVQIHSLAPLHVMAGSRELLGQCHHLSLCACRRSEKAPLCDDRCNFDTLSGDVGQSDMPASYAFDDDD